MTTRPSVVVRMAIFKTQLAIALKHHLGALKIVAMRGSVRVHAAVMRPHVGGTASREITSLLLRGIRSPLAGQAEALGQASAPEGDGPSGSSSVAPDQMPDTTGPSSASAISSAEGLETAQLPAGVTVLRVSDIVSGQAESTKSLSAGLGFAVGACCRRAANGNPSGSDAISTVDAANLGRPHKREFDDKPERKTTSSRA